MDRGDELTEEDKKPLVSIIVPTYNSAKTIGTYLESVKYQTYPNIEVIIVDNLSSDNTTRIAEKYGAKVIKQKSSMSEARNIGASYAQGEYFWFMDSDMELTPNVVERCVYACEKEKYDAVIIPERSRGDGFWAKCRGLEKQINNIDIHKNACRFMRKDVFEALGGYDINLVAGEDYDFHVMVDQAGYRYKIIDSFIYHLEVPSISKMMVKYFNYGKSISKYIKKRPIEATKQFFIFRPAYLKNYRLFLKHPITGLGLMCMKTLQYSAGFIGILFYSGKKFIRW